MTKSSMTSEFERSAVDVESTFPFLAASLQKGAKSCKKVSSLDNFWAAFLRTIALSEFWQTLSLQTGLISRTPKKLKFKSPDDVGCGREIGDLASPA